MASKLLGEVLEYAETQTASELILLVVLADCTNGSTGRCDPSIRYLAKHCRMTERTVQNALSALEARGLIAIERRFNEHQNGRQIPNAYRIIRTWSGEPNRQGEGAEFSPGEGANFSPGRVKPASPGRVQPASPLEPEDRTGIKNLLDTSYPTLPPVAPRLDPDPDPATMFLEPAAPLTPPTPSLPDAPASEEPAFTEDEQGLALPPPGVMPRALSKQEKQVIGRRAHILASGYYKAIGEKPPRAGIASADARRAFEHLALDYDGYVDAADVEGCTRWLMTDPFWKPGSSLTPAAVGKRVIQWIDQDRPTHAKPVSRRQQQTAAFADDLKSNRDQARDLIRQRMGIDPTPVDIEPANTFEASYVVNE